MSDKPIYVTQPYLPPLEEFIPYLAKIWESKFLTNNGPFHQQLEKALCDYLGVEHLALFTNGTIALVTALQALRITGEVITHLVESTTADVEQTVGRAESAFSCARRSRAAATNFMARVICWVLRTERMRRLRSSWVGIRL